MTSPVHPRARLLCRKCWRIFYRADVILARQCPICLWAQMLIQCICDGCQSWFPAETTTARSCRVCTAAHARGTPEESHADA